MSKYIKIEVPDDFEFDNHRFMDFQKDGPEAIVSVKEWKPGLGKKPFMYHPAGGRGLVWRPLPLRPARLGPQAGPGPSLPSQGGVIQ